MALTQNTKLTRRFRLGRLERGNELGLCLNPGGCKAGLLVKFKLKDGIRCCAVPA